MSPLTRRQFIAGASGLAVVVALPTPARGLIINPRSTWGADLPPKGPLSPEDVKFLIVHHSASNNGHTAADVPNILRSWYEFHTGPEKGWPDIAYNFVIDSAGGIWEGRQGSIDGPIAGSATGGNQGFTQLVCLIGDTNVTPASAAAHSSLVALLAWLADRYGVSTAEGAEVSFVSRGSNLYPAGVTVTTSTIAGHRDMSQTTCPGDSLYGYVTGGLRADVEAARGGSAPPPPTTTSTAPTTTTTAALTTTTAPTTTTTLSPTTTTTLPPTTVSSTTTVPVSTSIPATTIPPSVTPVAVGEIEGGSGAPSGMIAAGTALVVAGAGVLFWRHRRMGRD